jgi:hypothetical protein
MVDQFRRGDRVSLKIAPKGGIGEITHVQPKRVYVRWDSGGSWWAKSEIVKITEPPYLNK